MSVLHGNGTGQTLGFKWVFRVWMSDESGEKQVGTVSTPEEAGYMIEELREMFGDGFHYRFSREKEFCNENHD